MLNIKNDSNLLQLMFRFGNYLLILPKFNFNNKTVQTSPWRVFNTVCFAFLVVCGYLFSATGRITHSYYLFGAIDKFLDFSTYTLLSLTNICIIAEALTKANVWEELIKLLLVTNAGVSKKKLCLYLNLLVLLHVCYVFLLVSDVNIWLRADQEAPLYKYYVLRIVQEYICLVMVFFMGILSAMLRKRFKKLGAFLSDPNRINVFALKKCAKFRGASNNSVAQFISFYRAAVCYNRIFCWQHLLIVTHAVFSILDNVEKALTYFGLNGNAPSVSYDKFFISLCVASISVLKVATIIISCDLTTREVDRFTAICYMQQQVYPEGFAEQHELIKLAVLASNLKVRFTAADFFEINRTTLFSVLSVVTTYFIIILEFRQ